MDHGHAREIEMDLPRSIYFYTVFKRHYLWQVPPKRPPRPAARRAAQRQQWFIAVGRLDRPDSSDPTAPLRLGLRLERVARHSLERVARVPTGSSACRACLVEAVTRVRSMVRSFRVRGMLAAQARGDALPARTLRGRPAMKRARVSGAVVEDRLLALSVHPGVAHTAESRRQEGCVKKRG